MVNTGSGDVMIVAYRYQAIDPKQCWLIIDKVQQHSLGAIAANFSRYASVINL